MKKLIITLILLLQNSTAFGDHYTFLSLHIDKVKCADGDFARIFLIEKEKPRVLIERTRVLVRPLGHSEQIQLGLPCLTAKEAVKLVRAQKLGELKIELAEKGPPESSLEIEALELPVTSIPKDFCAAE